MLEMTIVGYIGRDATINESGSKKVINFSVAHTEKYKDATGTPVEKTTWVECAKWGDNTSLAQYLKKGTIVAVTGRPEANGYINREQKPASTLRCHVMTVQLFGSAKEETLPTAAAVPAQPSTAEQTEDLPF